MISWWFLDGNVISKEKLRRRKIRCWCLSIIAMKQLPENTFLSSFKCGQNDKTIAYDLEEVVLKSVRYLWFYYQFQWNAFSITEIIEIYSKPNAKRKYLLKFIHASRGTYIYWKMFIYSTFKRKRFPNYWRKTRFIIQNPLREEKLRLRDELQNNKNKNKIKSVSRQMVLLRFC